MLRQLISGAGVVSLICVNLAAANPSDRESLKGIKSAYVTVEAELQSPESLAQLRSDTELKLRIAKMQVILPPLEADDFSAGVPILHIAVSEFKNGPTMAYSVRLGLQQYVTPWARIGELLRHREQHPGLFFDRFYYGTTWSRDAIGIARVEVVTSIIRDKVRDFVDEFVNDWLAANSPDKPAQTDKK
jgi:hypothetical protein